MTSSAMDQAASPQQSNNDCRHTIAEDSDSLQVLVYLLERCIMIRQFMWVLTASLFLTGQSFATTFSIPTDILGDAGDRLLVPILVDDSTGLQGINFGIEYDPAMLSLTNSDVMLGQLLIDAGDWQIESNVDNASGMVAVAMFGPAALGPDSGPFAVLDFEILGSAEGDTMISLTGPDTLGGIAFDYQDGNAVISIPEPSSVVLTFLGIIGMLGFAVLRRK